MRASAFFTLLPSAIILLQSCNPKEQSNTTTAPDPPRDEYAYFKLTDVPLSSITLIDAKGGKTKSLPVAEAGFSDEAVLIVPLSQVYNADTAAGYFKASYPDDTTRNIYRVKCWTRWLYTNVARTFTCEVYDPYLTARVLPNYGTNTSFTPTIRKMTINGAMRDAVGCGATVIGEVTCKNSCGCPACISCRFQAPGLNLPAEQPGGDPASITYGPCNSLNNCSGDGGEPPEGGGGPLPVK